jgi:hypothetical protein
MTWAHPVDNALDYFSLRKELQAFLLGEQIWINLQKNAYAVGDSFSETQKLMVLAQGVKEKLVLTSPSVVPTKRWMMPSAPSMTQIALEDSAVPPQMWPVGWAISALISQLQWCG